MQSQEELKILERKVTLGQATDQEKVDFAALAGRLASSVHVPLLLRLLGDEDSEVRYYALQSLVLDRLQADGEMLDRCWQILERDEDEYVRRMAASGIGSILAGSNDLAAFDRLKKMMQATDSEWLRESLYSAMQRLAGAPAREWAAALAGDWTTPSPVDWADVARVEDRIRAAQPR
jgi:vesicle coat complex subunit